MQRCIASFKTYNSFAKGVNSQNEMNKLYVLKEGEAWLPTSKKFN